MDELDRGSGGQGVATVAGGKEDEQRPQPLPAGREGLSPGLGDRAWMARDEFAKAILQRGHEGVEPGSLPRRP